MPSGYALQYNAGEIDLVATPVPEPGTWIAGLGTFAFLACSQLIRRRRSFLNRRMLDGVAK
jgi:hypothetical protein